MEVGSAVRVRGLGRGRPPQATVSRVYANGDLKVTLTSGSRAGESVRVSEEQVTLLGDAVSA